MGYFVAARGSLFFAQLIDVARLFSLLIFFIFASRARVRGENSFFARVDVKNEFASCFGNLHSPRGSMWFFQFMEHSRESGIEGVFCIFNGNFKHLIVYG